MDHRAGEERTPLRKQRAGSGTQDVDAGARAERLRAASWSIIGLALGAMGAFAGVTLRGWHPLPAILVGLGAWALVFVGPLVVTALGGRAASTLYSPSGGSTPRRREYSHAESLAARGLYQEAVDAFEMAILEDPRDPTPYLRVARLQRDRLGRLEEAARWFVRARAQSEMPAGLDLACVRELVELYEVKMAEPARAAPVLARFADQRAGTPEGEWAVGELRRIKERMTAESG